MDKTALHRGIENKTALHRGIENKTALHRGIENKTALLQLSNTINAINNKTRLAIMGLLYFEKLTFEEIVSQTKIDENKIAYHLNILLEADMIKRKKIKYQNTRFGIRLMKDIGYIKEIKNIK